MQPSRKKPASLMRSSALGRTKLCSRQTIRIGTACFRMLFRRFAGAKIFLRTQRKKSSATTPKDFTGGTERAGRDPAVGAYCIGPYVIHLIPLSESRRLR